jgi:hypothetical protein
MGGMPLIKGEFIEKKIFSDILAVLSPVYVEPTHRQKMSPLNRKIIWQIVAGKWTHPPFPSS